MEIIYKFGKFSTFCVITILVVYTTSKTCHLKDFRSDFSSTLDLTYFRDVTHIHRYKKYSQTKGERRPSYSIGLSEGASHLTLIELSKLGSTETINRYSVTLLQISQVTSYLVHLQEGCNNRNCRWGRVQWQQFVH